MSAKKSKSSKTRSVKTSAPRSWEPIVAVVLAVGLVGLIFYMTNRETESPTARLTSTTETSRSTTAVDPFRPERTASVDRIDVTEAKRLLDEGLAVTVDVRDVQSYVAGHIPGALQIPLQYVAGEVPWFPRDKTIITYCT